MKKQMSEYNKANDLEVKIRLKGTNKEGWIEFEELIMKISMTVFEVLEQEKGDEK